ncbi:MAG: hypothetical protein GY839_08535 [candidate division Zixibacteria bacterium]|nr:hypothetical protein [candidate division Zixibacteria bacterium]
MGNKFIVKKLAESYEIQKSYDSQNFVEVVIKCRIYIESWLGEYIAAILYPNDVDHAEKNRAFVKQRFDSLFKQIDWLKRKGHIGQNDYDDLNNIRNFCDKVIKEGDVFAVVDLEQLDKYIEAAIYYCEKLKNDIQQIINEPL